MTEAGVTVFALFILIGGVAVIRLRRQMFAAGR
jgi:hypothetical protein